MGSIVGKGRRIDDAHPCKKPEVRLAGLRRRRPRGAVPALSLDPIRATMPAASTGAAAIVTGCAPAIVTRAAGARSHRPRQGERNQVRCSVGGGLSLRTERTLNVADHRLGAGRRHAMSSHTWATTGGRGFVANSA